MNRNIAINGVNISDDSDCYVIAEIGHNHQGNLETAKEMFLVAKKCGANAVKLQKRDNKSLYTKNLYHLPYDNENSYGLTYGKHREALEFSYDDYVTLKKYAEEIDLTMFATAFDFASVDFLEKLSIPAYKVASGDLNNTPLIKYIAQTGKPMFVSTGGSHLEAIKHAYDTIMPINQNLCIMQCTASYPADPEEMNLRVIETYQKTFPDILIGLSDHQNGIALAVVAYMLGARVIEKHFTLNRALKGTDHSFSLEPIGLKKMVRDLKRTRVALGDGIKRPFPSEKKPLFKMGKKLVAAHHLEAGHIIADSDIAIKSPNDGISPNEYDNILGMMLKRPLKEDENFSFEDLVQPQVHETEDRKNHQNG